ncbi:MAG: CvpA family protein [Neisseriaceae bacterium]|nr:CvpA family protein [Neisseriaceae bacterium]
MRYFDLYTTVDWVIVLVMSVSMLIGLRRGLIAEVLSLATLAFASYASKTWGSTLAPLMPIAQPAAQLAAGFLSVFVGVWLVMILLHMIINTIMNTLKLTGLNRLLGILFGAIRGGLIVIIGLIIINFLPYKQSYDWQQSQLRPFFDQVIPFLTSSIPYDFSKTINLSQ